MTKKGKALKALLILALAVALCMYFSRTIQTITTPKVQLVQASNGRIEKKTPVTGFAYFPVKTEVTLKSAETTPITVDKVYVKAGLYVKAGDILFTANLTDYDTKETELKKNYNDASQELINLDITNRKSSKQSKQNDLYDAMIAAQDALTNAVTDARMAAAADGIDLTSNMNVWGTIAMQKKASQSVLDLIVKAQTAKSAFDNARTAFYNSYENKQIKVADEVFKYINERNALVTKIDGISDDMVKLLAAKNELSVVKAESEGYIVDITVKPSEPYEGKTPAYTIAKKEDAPCLRVDVTSLKQDVAEGAKVEVTGDYDTFKTKVTAVVEDTDGSKYAEIELTDDILRAAGSMTKLLSGDGLAMSIVFRSKKNATIIPASAVRSEGEGSEYVFVVENQYGGFLSSGGMIARKTPITIIDRGDTAVSIEQDLGYQQIIDRADRTIEDGKPVMEYVD